MWLVNPQFMCRKHLLGEHVELHMIVGCINRGTSLEGYYENGLINTAKIRIRHEELAKEIAKRGYKHNSPLPEFKDPERGVVDILKNLLDLTERCEECKAKVLSLRTPTI
jgi:hypothetical protein